MVRVATPRYEVWLILTPCDPDKPEQRAAVPAWYGWPSIAGRGTVLQYRCGSAGVRPAVRISGEDAEMQAWEHWVDKPIKCPSETVAIASVAT
jgi:hypothetical protein